MRIIHIIIHINLASALKTSHVQKVSLYFLSWGCLKTRDFPYFLQVNNGIVSYNMPPHLPFTTTPNDQSRTVYRRSTWLTSREARNFRSTAGSALNLMVFYRTLKIKCSQLNKVVHFSQTIHKHTFYTFK